MSRTCLLARWVWVLTLWFLWSAVGYAEQPQLKWDPVPGAGGYLIEIRSRDGKSVVSETLERPVYELSLDAGDYEMRITTLDKSQKKGESTPWSTFKVLQILEPSPTQVIPNTVLTSQAKEFSIRGTGFSAGADVLVINDESQEFRPNRRRTVSSTELKISFTSALPPGTYSIVVQNPQGRKASLLEVLTVRSPEPEPVVTVPDLPEPVSENVAGPLEEPISPTEVSPKTGYTLGLGSSVAWAFPPWNQLVGVSLLNFDLSGRMPFQPHLDVYGVLRYSVLSSPAGTDLVDLKISSESFLLGATFSTPWLVPVRFRLAPGLTATQAEIDGSMKQSLNISLSGGIGVPIYLQWSWEGEIGLESQIIFYTGIPLVQLSLSWRTEYLF